jgi:lysophospholipase L1-like esterase
VSFVGARPIRRAQITIGVVARVRPLRSPGRLRTHAPSKACTLRQRHILMVTLCTAVGCGGSTHAPEGGAVGASGSGSGANNSTATDTNTTSPQSSSSSSGADMGAAGSSGGSPASSGSGGSPASSGSGGSNGSSSGAAGGSSSGAIALPDAGARGGGDSGPTVVGDAAAGGPVVSDAGPVDTSKKITVWLSGDSTMQPCSACICGWGSQFQAYFNNNVTVVDSAVGGRSIQTWLYDPNVSTTLGPNGECVVSPMTYSARWQAMLDPITGMKPGDYLFIEFGINDGTSTCDRHVGTALFQTYLTVMAQAAKMRGAIPIYLTSTNAIICSGATIPLNRGFGPQTKAAGMANGVTVIDLTQLTSEYYAALGLCPNDGNYNSTTTLLGQLFCDHTHTKAAGAVRTASVVAKALRDQAIPLAAYLK